MSTMNEAFKKVGIHASGTKINSDRTIKGNRSDRQDRSNKFTEHEIEAPKIVLRENDLLRRALLTDDALAWASLIYDNGNGVTATQLRNFYNEVKALQSRIEADGFLKNEAMIGLLKSKAAYAFARAEKKRKTGFTYLKSMLEQGSDLSTSKQAFDDFALFFEAVMGFFKGR